MANGNALSSVSGPPPAPNPQGGESQNNLAMPAAASMSVPMNGQPQPQTPPAPSHQQTVAALRHFSAIERELSSLLTDPDLGKADLKSKIIDGATQLVAQGILSPAQASVQLGTVPERPFDQKRWVEMNFAQVIQNSNSVLDHHRAAFAGMPPQPDNGSPDNHQDMMSALMSQYQRPS